MTVTRLPVSDADAYYALRLVAGHAVVWWPVGVLNPSGPQRWQHVTPEMHLLEHHRYVLDELNKKGFIKVDESRGFAPRLVRLTPTGKQLLHVREHEPQEEAA
ncbi:MAG: hypothetical protein ACREQ5_03980 [Candidatus Dormibacteria bacterium]